MDLDLPRSTTSVALLVEHGRTLGLGADELLAGLAVEPSDLDDPEAVVTGRDEVVVLGRLAVASEDRTALGLALGGRYHLTTYGIWGFTLASSPTLRSAIEVGLRHLGLTYALVDLAFADDGDGPRLVLDATGLPAEVATVALARDAAAVATLRADLHADASVLREVRFGVSAPTVALPDLGAPCVFDAPRTEVVLSPRALDAPLPQSDPRTRAVMEAQCRELLERRRRRGGLAGQVRDRLVADPSRMPSMDEVAAAHHVATRTLRRHLTAEGTSFRDLVDEVREALAVELLGAGRLTVEETAHRLGYAEPAAFIHAFRRWRGTTPGAWRAEQAGPG